MHFVIEHSRADQQSETSYPPSIIFSESDSTTGKTTDSPGPSPVPSPSIEIKAFCDKNRAISSDRSDRRCIIFCGRHPGVSVFHGVSS